MVNLKEIYILDDIIIIKLDKVRLNNIIHLFLISKFHNYILLL
jgi:hypothetical protein